MRMAVARVCEWLPGAEMEVLVSALRESGTGPIIKVVGVDTTVLLAPDTSVALVPNAVLRSIASCALPT